MALLLREPLSEMQRAAHFRRMLDAASQPGALRPRLARSQRGVLTMSVFAIGEKPVSDLHAQGVARFLEHHDQQARQCFLESVVREPGAASWNDLAATEIRLGDRTADPEHYVAALDAVGKALALDASLPEAHFNRALIFERLGFERASIAVWQEFVRVDGGSQWSTVVQKHIAELSMRETARFRWIKAGQRIVSIEPAELEKLIADYPGEARLWGESVFPPLWAYAYQAHDHEAGLFLERSKSIAGKLASSSGEKFLQQSLAAIDAGHVDILASAYASYRDGRYALRDGHYDVAMRHLETARMRFAAGRSPMAAKCELYLAMIAILNNRIVAARTALTALLERERTMSGHPALVAEIEYQLALALAMNGEFGDALPIATSSKETFERLGERGNAGKSEVLIGDLLAILGQPQLAWRHMIAGAAASSLSGDVDRLQACASTMNQIELHRHHWGSARALSGLELALRGAADFRADAHLRNAAAAIQDNDPSAARSSLERADVAAASIADAAIRDKLLADIAGVEGQMIAAFDPAAAIAKLTASIEFQRRVGRAFALPELYLERGRAHLALGTRPAALADFESGIRSLEAQRSRVRDFELRAGAFDDDRALFSEAVNASLLGEDAGAAFGYVERGRARALLDELAEETQLPRMTTMESVRENLPPGTLVISFASLEDRLAIFIVDRDHGDVRIARITPAELAQQTKELVRDLGEHRNINARSAKLYEELLSPIAPELGAATRLVIIPDPTLEQLPFAALFDLRKQKYLAETHEIVMEPSAAVYVACRRRSKMIEAPPAIALFANPTTTLFPDLPAAEHEVSSIARRYAHSLVRTRGAATAQGFLEDAARYGIIQFSGHAKIDRAEPWKSALMFETPLTAREIGRIHFANTNVVVLAACSTLAFDSDRVEGTSAIARSFLIAGVPTVIGSLWDVDDDDAAAVVIRLHERLARGATPAAALRDVQRELIHNPTHHDPAAWAAFTVVGN